MRVKKLLRILLYSLAALVAILLLVAGATQTQIFRDGLRSFALSRLDSLLDADVQLGTITGNLISGFSIDHISIRVGHDYVIMAERLDLRYDLFEIPGKKISVDNLTLVRPHIALLRGRDSLWNFVRMVRPPPADTSKGKPFDWTLNVKHFQIDDGTFVLVDSASLAEPDHPAEDPYYVEYHNVALRRINLKASLVFSQEEKQAIISDFRFDADRPSFSLKGLTGDFRVTRTEARIKNMVLKTGVSQLAIDASMQDFDLLGGIELRDLQKKPVRLSLHAHDIDLNELKRFIQPIGFLNSRVSLDLDAKGEFGELSIASLRLGFGESQFSIAGTLYNLQRPGDLYLNTRFERSIVFSPDVRTILPTFNLPDLEALGHSKLSLTFVGKPLDFQTQVALESDAGTVHAEGGLKIGGANRLQYKGKAEYRGIDLAAVTGNTHLKSNLNGTLEIDGRGVSLDNLLTTLDVQLDSSDLAGRHGEKAQVRIEAADRRITANGNLDMGPMRTRLSAVLDRREQDNPSFSLDGNVTSLDLEHVLLDPSYGSDLNLSLTARGSGLTWGTLNGEFVLDFNPSRYREYRIDSSDVTIAFDQHNPAHKQLTLTSNIADFSLTGTFDTEYMKDLIAYELLSLRKAVGEKFVSLDSSLSANVDPAVLAALGKKLSAQAQNLNTSFSLRVKDLEPVSAVAGDRTFDGRGILSGTMRGNFQNLSLDARLMVDDFFYGNADSGVLVHDGSATMTVSSLKPKIPLQDIAMRLVVQAEKMHINRTECDSLQVSFKYEQEYSSYTFSGHYNRDTRVEIQGFSNIKDDFLNFTLNSFHFAFRDFVWQADGGAVIGFGPHGIRIDNLAMRRDTQIITLSGAVIKGKSLVASATAHSINLDDLRYLMTQEEIEAKNIAFAGIADVDVKAGGTPEDPTYSAALNARSVAFRGVPLGDIGGAFTYGNHRVSVDLDVVNQAHSPKAHPDLVVQGIIPVHLGPGPAEDSQLEEPMDLVVQSEGIQIGILDPILPTFNQLTGIMKCNVKVGGSPKNPQYSGTLSMENCSFLFVPNLIHYSFEGQFRFNGDRIEVVDAVVHSNPLDDQLKRPGLIHLTGDFALRDFKPTDFNLTADGGLLVVREDTRKSSLSVSGNLFVETGPHGIHYTGEIEQSLLKGPVFVNNSSLVFPPTQQVANDQMSNTVPVRILDDTTKVTIPVARPLADRYFGGDGMMGQENGTTGTEEQSTSKSFVDGIRYDLDIECTGGNTEVKMIFNSATGEELDANINGRFSITEDGKRWIGAMTIDRAYYRFIKQFNAQGTMTYSGDFLNPELDITATFEGIRSSPDTTSASRPEKVVVSMKITGTRYAPKLEWSMTIDDVDYYSYKGVTSSDVETDALAFILAGNFPLSRSQANNVAADLVPTARSSLVTGASSLLTNAFGDFLRKNTTIINYFELSYGAERSFDQAVDIRFGGSVGPGFWRIGGKILNDPFSNANVSLLYSLGDIVKRPTLRNFMIELERKVETNTIDADRTQTNSARLFYRFSF